MKKLMALVIAVSMLTSYASMSMSASAETTTAQRDSSENTTYYSPVSFSDEIEKNDTQVSENQYADFEYTILDDDTIEITDYKGEGRDVVIPSKIDGKSVTSIRDYAFAYCKSLTNITIPDSVTSIGWCAFLRCSSLTSITISSSITSIGDDAFSDCSNLKSVTIPDSVTSIGDSAFRGCRSLTSITIPKSVTSIGDDAFFLCNNLMSINVDDNNENYSSLDGFLFNKEQTKIIACPNALTGEYTIPESVTSIGNSAFDGCSSLTSITIPSSITSIDYGAFSACRILTNINVDDNNENYSSLDGILFNKEKTKIIAYPGGITGEYNIPNSVTSIGEYAFDYCHNLTNITIPNSVTSICERAFFTCENLTSITIPNSVTSIKNEAFQFCINLASITIPNSVTSIGHSAFSVCEKLEDVYYLGTEEEWNSIYISRGNASLTTANIHFNWIDTDTSTDTETDIPFDITGTIYFDASEWESEKVHFYIWDETDGTYATQNGWVDENPWGSKKIAGTPVEGKDGVFESYEIEFKNEHELYVIFYDPDTGAQTESCELDSSKIGYTVKPIADPTSAPTDGHKGVYIAIYFNENDNPVGTIYFDASEWGSEKVYFYIWDETEGTYATKDGWVDENPWGSKKTAGTPVEGKDCLFESYEIEFKDDHELFVIFYDPDTGSQTTSCEIDFSKIGYTAYPVLDTTQAPSDDDNKVYNVEFYNDDIPVDPIGMYGDMTGDGRINTIDALYVQRFTVGYSKLTDTEKVIADVNLDDRVNSIDTLTILRYCAGYTDDTNVGQYVYPSQDDIIA